MRALWVPFTAATKINGIVGRVKETERQPPQPSVGPGPLRCDAPGVQSCGTWRQRIFASAEKTKMLLAVSPPAMRSWRSRRILGSRFPAKSSTTGKQAFTPWSQSSHEIFMHICVA